MQCVITELDGSPFDLVKILQALTPSLQICSIKQDVFILPFHTLEMGISKKSLYFLILWESSLEPSAKTLKYTILVVVHLSNLKKNEFTTEINLGLLMLSLGESFSSLSLFKYPYIFYSRYNFDLTFYFEFILVREIALDIQLSYIPSLCWRSTVLFVLFFNRLMQLSI